MFEGDIAQCRMRSEMQCRIRENCGKRRRRCASSHSQRKMKHQNSQSRIYGDFCYFITCNVEDKLEIFRNVQFCEFWIEELKLCKEMKNFKLYAFCLNYDHFHFVIKPDNKIADYSQIMHFLKRNFSQNINKILGYTQFKTTLPEGDITQCRIRENFVTEDDDTHKRIESDDAHRRLREFDEITKKYRRRYISLFEDRSHPKFKWQKSFYDHIIRNETDYQFHWNYTMHNYRKHGLPENWKFTGLKYPDLIDDIYQEII